MPTRRDFIQNMTAAVAMLAAGRASAMEPENPDEAWKQARVMTVRGPVPAGELGACLPHEHLLVDFIGADKVSPDRYAADAAFRALLPRLQELREAGVRAMMECTPDYIGRDAALCRRLAEAADMHILSNTGYYAAANEKFLPPQAYSESADQLAARWSNEARNGIADTEILPGFLKIAVNPGPLSEVSQKLVRAAARCHLETGLPIASHTGPGRPAIEQLDLLEEEGVTPHAFIWVHAQNENDTALHVEAAGRGAWVELDGFGQSPERDRLQIGQLNALREAGLLHRVLLSHDAGWYRVGEPDPMRGFRPYTTLFRDFLPLLEKEHGYSSEILQRITQRQPAEAFSLKSLS